MDTNDITYQINGAVFEVNRILGHGFLDYKDGFQFIRRTWGELATDSK